MNTMNNISAQFGNPSGVLGNLAGYIMAYRKSNIERNYWAISLLKLQPADQVLEIGFGPGIAIEKMSKMISDGTVWGIDHSNLMVQYALERNKKAIMRGSVKLLAGSVSNLPHFDKKLDKVISVNSFQFWPNQVEVLKNIRAKMKQSGIIALAYQPQKPGAKEIDAFNTANKIADYLEKAGFAEIKIERRKMKPVMTVCVLGKNQEKTIANN